MKFIELPQHSPAGRATRITHDDGRAYGRFIFQLIRFANYLEKDLNRIESRGGVQILRACSSDRGRLWMGGVAEAEFCLVIEDRNIDSGASETLPFVLISMLQTTTVSTTDNIL